MSRSLLLLLAETNQDNPHTLAGLPSTGENTQKTYVLLGGRVLVVLMFITLIDYSGSILYLIPSFACLALILMVAIGFKTKLSSMILISLLTIINVTHNAFWTARLHDAMWDYLKYDFFQTLSVIGGLLMIVAHGPGGVSVDDFKKKW
ncbi:Surfeit locus protein 4 [Cichlidogyrus casuarinus]|uniref:Surfeit locus protein 4 n=1 Tax=Cichlidogyrus casuarinus TaxID=1844966 RepID=A0ABD2QEF5_9PLAT